MARALEQAARAAGAGEVPVGAVVVQGDRVVALAHNRREADQDPTAHAEVLAVRAAASALGSWRLDGCTVYVTLEPCPMCAGALWLARVDRLVYATRDEKAGAAGTLYNVAADPRLNHQIQIDAGLMEAEARALLQDFFRRLRRKGGQQAAVAGSEGCPSG